MTFDDVLAHVLDLHQRQGRVSYRAPKRRFDLDGEDLEDLKAELTSLVPPWWLRLWARRTLCPGAAPTPCCCSRRRWNKPLH